MTATDVILPQADMLFGDIVPLPLLSHNRGRDDPEHIKDVKHIAVGDLRADTCRQQPLTDPLRIVALLLQHLLIQVGVVRDHDDDTRSARYVLNGFTARSISWPSGIR